MHRSKAITGVPKITFAERECLHHIVYQYAKLPSVYFFQSLCIYLRVKHALMVRGLGVESKEVYRDLLAACFNIALHFLGPQSACRETMVFRERCKRSQSNQQTLRILFVLLLGYKPAPHLQSWQLATRIQWHIILQLLNGRIQ